MTLARLCEGEGLMPITESLAVFELDDDDGEWVDDGEVFGEIAGVLGGGDVVM